MEVSNNDLLIGNINESFIFVENFSSFNLIIKFKDEKNQYEYEAKSDCFKVIKIDQHTDIFVNDIKLKHNEMINIPDNCFSYQENDETYNTWVVEYCDKIKDFDPKPISKEYAQKCNKNKNRFIDISSDKKNKRNIINTLKSIVLVRNNNNYLIMINPFKYDIRIYYYTNNKVKRYINCFAESYYYDYNYKCDIIDLYTIHLEKNQFCYPGFSSMKCLNQTDEADFKIFKDQIYSKVRELHGNVFNIEENNTIKEFIEDCEKQFEKRKNIIDDNKDNQQDFENSDNGISKEEEEEEEEEIQEIKDLHIGNDDYKILLHMFQFLENVYIDLDPVKYVFDYKVLLRGKPLKLTFTPKLRVWDTKPQLTNLDTYDLIRKIVKEFEKFGRDNVNKLLNISLWIKDKNNKVIFSIVE